MFAWLRKRDTAIPEKVYAAIANHSRNEALFRRYGFADTPTGRFDALALHMFLFSRRMAGLAGPDAASLNQDVFDVFTAELDSALRELGVGDTSVPKRKKKMIATFYTMAASLPPALEAGDPAELEKALAACLQDGGSLPRTDRLATYVRAAAGELQTQQLGDFTMGRIRFPDPARIAETE